MEEVMADIEQEMRLGKGKNSRSPRRSRADPLPSPEVKRLLGKANMLYIQREYEQAITILQEVIRIEPAIRTSWNTLGAIHEELGNYEKALQVHIVSAHLGPKSSEVWKELAVKSRDLKLTTQAIYCYSQAISANRSDVDALWDRAALYLETAQYKPAIASFQALLVLHPHDALTLRTLVPILLETKERDKAFSLLSKAFEYQQSQSPEGPGPGGLNVSDLCLLVELTKGRESWSTVIALIKSGQRWLQGRSEQGQIWARYRDDREFDLRRKFRPDWDAEEQWKFLESLPTFELAPELRAALTVARLAVKDLDEAQVRSSTKCSRALLREVVDSSTLRLFRILMFMITRLSMVR